jgi:dTDP-4-amino-4,6-dideoxygalactose transaminase
MLNTPFPPWPVFSEEEVEVAASVLRTGKVNYWTGQECRAFENEFAAWCGCGHAISLFNGTVALEIALRAIDLKPDDEVIVTPRSFIASVSCVAMLGATPVFADVDRDTQNLSAQTIAAVLTPRTRAVVVVHLAGMPCDMDPILTLAQAHGLAVIEDCAQAHGARYKGRMVGSLGDIGAWSFCQDKIMTTGGEGGMVTTNDAALWSKMWSAKDHGKSWHSVFERQHPPGFRWLHDGFGGNGRMLEIQAAIGRVQLARMPNWHTIRLRNAAQIWNTAQSLRGLRVPAMPEWAEHAAYKAYIFVAPDDLLPGWNRDRIMAEMNGRGVPCYSGSCSEIYLENAFNETVWRPQQRLPVARELGETSLMFLVHPSIGAEFIDRTCRTLSEVMHQAADQG